MSLSFDHSHRRLRLCEAWGGRRHSARTCSNTNASPLTDRATEAERLSPLRILRPRRCCLQVVALFRTLRNGWHKHDFNKHDCVATGRAPCAIRREGRSLALSPKNTPLFAPTRGRFLWRAFKNLVSLIWRATSAYHFTSLHFKKEIQEPYGRILIFFVTSTRSGQGMVHDTQLNAPYHAIRSCSYWRHASGQSTSSAIFRKCSDLFARSSISFVTEGSI